MRVHADPTPMFTDALRAFFTTDPDTLTAIGATVRVASEQVPQDWTLNSGPLLTVHDELVLEAPTKDAKKVAAFVQETMEGAFELDVPIVAEAKIGNNWGEMKEVTS